MPWRAQPTPFRTAILGASGYTGAELVRILLHHPSVEIRTLTADRHAGKRFDAVFPQFGGRGLPDLIRIEDADWDAHDLVFCCLPHGTTQEAIAALPEHASRWSTSRPISAFPTSRPMPSGTATSTARRRSRKTRSTASPSSRATR